MYDLDWLIKQYRRKTKLKYLYFWGHQPSADGKLTHSCFSQWWQSPFVVDGVTYATAEHYMMAQKARLFKDETMFEQIVAAKTPKAAKALGRKVSGFDNDIWNQHRFDIVVAGNVAKFAQHADLKHYLLNTGKRVLVEASPVDKIWGVGLANDDERISNPLQWQGLNLLGFALMQVRDNLKDTI